MLGHTLACPSSARPALSSNRAVISANIRAVACRHPRNLGATQSLAYAAPVVIAAEDQISIVLDRERLAHALLQSLCDDPDRLVITAPATKIRAGKATKLVIGNITTRDSRQDDQLIALLIEAREAREAVLASPKITIKDQAIQRTQCRHRLAKLVRLS